MIITVIRSDKIYRKMTSSTPESREDIYRNELMKAFEFKWNCVGIPLKADQPGGLDVVSACTMGGGYHPADITMERLKEIDAISGDELWNACVNSIRNSLEGFLQRGIMLPKQEYVFTLLLNDPKNPMSAMTGDCCGDGGIPGYILGTIIPNENSLKQMPVTLAHETNHSVRWQLYPWKPQMTLADYVISEGLAENFATEMFGEDKLGKWVNDTDSVTLETVIIPAIRDNLYETDANKVFAYLYGDEIISMRGIPAVGMPYCAGYAFGYALIKHYMKKTDQSIYEATTASTEAILEETKDFWQR